MDDRKYFHPESVDKQVDALLQAGPTSKEEMRTVHVLQDLYQSDLQSLERVWKRLDIGVDMDTKELSEQNNSTYNHTSSPHLERPHSVQGKCAQHQRTNPWQGLTRRLGIIAAVLVAALLVGSLLTVLNITRGQHSTTLAGEPQAKPPSGLYLSYDKGVTKIDPSTGKTIWRYNLAQTKTMPQRGTTKIIMSGNTLFVMINNELKNTMDAGLVALNAQNGAILWQKKLPTVVTGWSNMVVAGNNTYVVSTDGTHFKSTIMVLDSSTGATKTTYGFQLAISGIVQDNGRLYLGTSQGLYVVNAPDGKVVWKDQVTRLNQTRKVLPHLVNNIVYAAFQVNGSSYLKAYNAQNGKQLWQSKDLGGLATDFTVSGPQLYIHVTYFSSTSGGDTIAAFNTQNGLLNWSVSMQNQIESEPEVSNNVVYFPTIVDGQNGKNYMLNALNASTGKRLWQKSIDDHDLGFNFNTALANDFIYNANANNSPQNKTVVSAYKFDGTQLWKITANEFVTSLEVTP